MGRRLLLTIPRFPPDPKAGGAEIFAMYVAEGLTANHGWEVTIVTTMPKGRIEGEVVSSSISVLRLPYRFILSNSPISVSWLRSLKRIIATVDPDVININLPVPGLGDMASYVGRRRPVVIYYHFGSMKKRNLVLDPVIAAYESFLLPRSLCRARRVVCGSAYVRDGILKRFRDKTSIIPPGVDLEQFHPAPQRVKDPNVLYVGSLNSSDQHKRFSDLLEACAILRTSLPDLRLFAAGGGDGRQMYEELAAKLDIADAVQFYGRLDGEALAQAYRSAAVLALPSLSETFGMVIIEAMASGLPVVAVNGGGVPALLDHNKDGLLVPPQNPHAMADALQRILTDPDESDAFAETGRRKVCARLGWPRQVASMNNILMAAADLPAKDAWV